MKRFLYLSLALVMVMGLILTSSAFTTESNVTSTTTDTDTTQGEVPLMMVTEGKLQTLKSANALSNGDVYSPDNPDAPMMMLSDDEDEGVMPVSGKLHLPQVSFTSSLEDYDTSFSCRASDGNRLNIWVQNNGSDTVVLNVDWSKWWGLLSESYIAVEIPAGSQQTMTFYYKDGSGIDGTWDINVTTLSGSPLNITVSARQYQYNG